MICFLVSLATGPLGSWDLRPGHMAKPAPSPFLLCTPSLRAGRDLKNILTQPEHLRGPAKAEPWSLAFWRQAAREVTVTSWSIGLSWFPAVIVGIFCASLSLPPSKPQFSTSLACVSPGTLRCFSPKLVLFAVRCISFLVSSFYPMHIP